MRKGSELKPVGLFPILRLGSFQAEMFFFFKSIVFFSDTEQLISSRLLHELLTSAKPRRRNTYMFNHSLQWSSSNPNWTNSVVLCTLTDCIQLAHMRVGKCSFFPCMHWVGFAREVAFDQSFLGLPLSLSFILLSRSVCSNVSLFLLLRCYISA